LAAQAVAQSSATERLSSARYRAWWCESVNAPLGAGEREERCPPAPCPLQRYALSEPKVGFLGNVVAHYRRSRSAVFCYRYPGNTNRVRLMRTAAILVQHCVNVEHRMSSSALKCAKTKGYSVAKNGTALALSDAAACLFFYVVRSAVACLRASTEPALNQLAGEQHHPGAGGTPWVHGDI
jgi:hypothetical protein